MNMLNLSFPQELAPLPMVSAEQVTVTTVPVEVSSADHDTLNIYGAGALIVGFVVMAGVGRHYMGRLKPGPENDAATENYLTKQSRESRRNSKFTPR